MLFDQPAGVAPPMACRTPPDRAAQQEADHAGDLRCQGDEVADPLAGPARRRMVTIAIVRRLHCV